MMAAEILPPPSGALARPLPLPPATKYLSRLSPGSRPTQRCALRQLADMLGELHGRVWTPDEVPWAELVTADTTDGLRELLIISGRKVATVRRILAALIGVMELLATDRLLDKGELDRIKAAAKIRSRNQRPVRKRLDQGQRRHLFKRLALDLDTAETGQAIKLARDAATIALLAGCGMRRQEVARLRREHVRADEVLIERGKGDKSRVVGLPAKVDRALGVWLDYRGEQRGPLLTTVRYQRQRAPLSIGHVNHIVASWGERVGMAGLAPHMLRRAYADELQAQGATLEEISELLGHAGVQTTIHYLASKTVQAVERSRGLEL